MPNFAMDTSDINPTASPEEERCTAHLFKPDKRDYLGDNTLPLGSPLRICTDRTWWPPAILFDAVYASAVLHHFGTTSGKLHLSFRVFLHLIAEIRSDKT
jgi:hypothetical protein